MKAISDTHRSLQAGALYFIIVFAVGFALGTIRFLVVVPMVGELVGVLIELPILLTLAWVISARVIVRTKVPHRLGSRLIVGASAFLLLVSAEFVLSIWVFGNPVDAHFAAFRTPHGAAGLAGQAIFALLPTVQLLHRPGP